MHFQPKHNIYTNQIVGAEVLARWQHPKQGLMSPVDQYQVPPEYIELELTESAFVDNVDQLYENIERLRKLGFKCSMDDFGTGYSSLHMLQNIPVDFIKMDRGFLNKTVLTSKGRTVVQSMIQMIQRMGMEVVAEGVETEEQVHILKEASCVIAQGFYYSRPMPFQEFEQFRKNGVLAE